MAKGKRKNARSFGGPTILVTHREFIADVVSTGTGFAVNQTITLDPADPSAFPWLAQIAAYYQRYRFKRLNIGYSSEMPTTSAGVVIVAFTSNPLAVAPDTKQVMLETNGCIKTNVWAPALMSIPISNSERILEYGESGSPGYAATTGTTISTYANPSLVAPPYATGKIFVALNGVSSGTVGELWLDYTVELIAPAPLPYPVPLVHNIVVASCGATTPFDTVSSIQNKGTYQVWFPNSTTLKVNVAGPFMLLVNGPTTTATASVAIAASAGALSLATSAIQTGGFNAIYTYSPATVPSLVTFDCSNFTNLLTSTSFPLTFRIVPWNTKILGLPGAL